MVPLASGRDDRDVLRCCIPALARSLWNESSHHIIQLICETYLIEKSSGAEKFPPSIRFLCGSVTLLKRTQTTQP